MAIKTVKTIVVRLTADAKAFRREMGRAVDFMDRSAARMRSAGAAMSLGVTLPILAAGAAAVKFAADAEEMESKLSVVFGKNAKDVRAWSNQYAKSVNRGQIETRRMVSDAGDLFKGMGLTTTQVLKMSKAMTSLADDISSFKNVEVDQAFIAIRGAVTGEFEALKTLGVVIKAAERDERALAIARKTGADEADNAVRSLAAMELVLERTKDAQGDAARTSNSLTNKLRGMSGRITDTATKLGNNLVPITEELVGWVIKMLDGLNGLNPQLIKWGIVGLGLLAVLGPIGFALGNLIPLVKSFGKGVALLLTPWGLVTAAIVAGLVVVVAWRREIGRVLNGVADDLAKAYDKMGKKTEGFWSETSRISRLFLGDIGAGLANKLEQMARGVDWFARKVVLGFGVAGQAMARWAGFDWYSPQLERLKQMDQEDWGGAFWEDLFNPEDAQASADLLFDNVISPTLQRVKDDWSELSDWLGSMVLKLPGFAPGTEGGALPDGGGGGGDMAPRPQGILASMFADDTKFMESIETQLNGVASVGELAAESVGEIGDRFVDAMASGESFGDAMKALFKQLLMDIAKAILKQLILNAVMGIAGAFGSSGAAPTHAINTTGGMDFAGFAHSGGHISGPTVVGERGLELFSPDRAGQVHSASSIAAALKGGGGGGGAVVNVIVENNAPGATADVDASDPNNIRVFIEQTAADSLSRGGPVWKAFQQKTGARSRTVQR